MFRFFLAAERMGGAEPDNCFTSKTTGDSWKIGRDGLTLPDLVKIGITSKSLDRLPIYARLGVPVWRYVKQLQLHQLVNGMYVETQVLLFLSFR